MEGAKHPTLRGRGTADNPANRFEALDIALDPGEFEEDSARPKTVFYRDASRRFIATNASPDVGYSASINPYRGCEHGCIYCYARPTHEYLGFSAGLDFETRIMVKTDAPSLLKRELSSRSWKPQVIGMSGVTDIYQPIERKLRLSRGCLEVLAEFRNPVAMITKNHLITRDLDLIADLARYDAVSVAISLTTLDDRLRRVMEPRTSTAVLRLAAIRELAAAGVHVGVMTAPIIPGLTDHEIPSLIAAAAEAGAKFAAYNIVHLPYGLKDLFADWLERHYPERKDKVLNRIREMRGGRLNDPRFGSRMSGEGVFAEQIRKLHASACRKAGFEGGRFRLSAEHFRRPAGVQGSLFD